MRRSNRRERIFSNKYVCGEYNGLIILFVECQYDAHYIAVIGNVVRYSFVWVCDTYTVKTKIGYNEQTCGSRATSL